MTKEEYKKLNDYLNDIFLSLEENDSFLLRNIRAVIAYNNDFINIIRKNKIKENVVSNHLTFDDVTNLTNEIMSSISPKYSHICDDMIKNGTIDFAYNNEYKGSYFLHRDCDINEINIKRVFNYDDVITLIHELIHYTNHSKNKNNINHLLGEFLSIYFELYATKYLLNKGILESEISKYDRLKSSYRCATSILDYEFIFLAYEKFGNIDKNTSTLIKDYIMGMKEEYFERDCRDFLKRNTMIIEKMKENLIPDIENKDDLYKYEYGSSYRYVLGSMYAFYALENCELEDMVKLNENINNFDNLYEAFKSIGIDVTSQNTLEMVLSSIEKYINEKVKIK